MNKVVRNINKVKEYLFFYNESLEKIKKELYNKKNPRVWFIGAAHYDNIGDQAISLATVEFIKNNIADNIIEVRLCDYIKFFRVLKKYISSEDIIVLQGGGNMGNLYFDAERNRRSVIKNFPRNKIVIFPSTIDYSNDKNGNKELEKSKKIYSNHKDLIICAREKKSFDRMKEYYSKNTVILMPDIVLSLNKYNFELQRKNICLCLRNDKEKNCNTEQIKEKINDIKEKVIITDNISKEKDIDCITRKQIVEEKLKEYSSYRAVITDRLHTMIFCYLTNTPCLFLDNSNGKVKGIYEDWICDCSYIKPLKNTDNYNLQLNEIEKVNNRKNEVKFEKIFKKLVDEMIK